MKQHKKMSYQDLIEIKKKMDSIGLDIVDRAMQVEFDVVDAFVRKLLGRAPTRDDVERFSTKDAKDFDGYFLFYDNVEIGRFERHFTYGNDGFMTGFSAVFKQIRTIK